MPMNEPVSAAPPHPLEDCFSGNAAQIIAKLTAHPVVRQAVENAIKARHQREEEFATLPNLMAPNPRHAAVRAFVESLDDPQGSASHA
jgi:hypothetical protein